MTKLLLSDIELNSLNELKEYFKASIEHIDNILKNKDIQINLDYLVRDHNIEAHRRNEVIKGHVKVLINLLNEVEKLND